MKSIYVLFALVDAVLETIFLECQYQWRSYMEQFLSHFHGPDSGTGTNICEVLFGFQLCKGGAKFY